MIISITNSLAKVISAFLFMIAAVMNLMLFVLYLMPGLAVGFASNPYTDNIWLTLFTTEIGLLSLGYMIVGLSLILALSFMPGRVGSKLAFLLLPIGLICLGVVIMEAFIFKDFGFVTLPNMISGILCIWWSQGTENAA